MTIPDEKYESSLSEDDVDGDGQAKNGGERPTQEGRQGSREDGQCQALVHPGKKCYQLWLKLWTPAIRIHLNPGFFCFRISNGILAA